jgi:hypothetical protein
MKLVFIHGRSQEKKDSSALRNEWIEAFEKGLKKNNLTLPLSLQIVLPYYGDKLYDLVNTDDVGKEIEGVISKGSADGDDLEFFYEFLTQVAQGASVTESDILAKYDGNHIEKGPTNWKWVLAIIRAIDAKTPFGNNTLKLFTYDVFLYLTSPGISETIHQIVNSAIDAEPCVVVGHSLGSIIGYNILSAAKNGCVHKYFTLGSPLGIKSINTKLSYPLQMPRCISKGWYNAYDIHDVVALNPIDKKHFNLLPDGANDAVTNYGKVNNWTNNRHGIAGYLDDAVVALELYKNLI